MHQKTQKMKMISGGAGLFGIRSGIITIHWSNIGTWSPFVVVGHLIHGEKTDWIPRAKIILENGSSQAFEPFDRFAQLQENKGKSLEQLLEELAILRKQNLIELKKFNLSSEDLTKSGIHPELGSVTLAELLSTWVVHDLGHIVQIARCMSKQYAIQVGPWGEYLTVLKDRQV
jgi:hypothetical protein